MIGTKCHLAHSSLNIQGPNRDSSIGPMPNPDDISNFLFALCVSSGAQRDGVSSREPVAVGTEREACWRRLEGVWDLDVELRLAHVPDLNVLARIWSVRSLVIFHWAHDKVIGVGCKAEDHPVPLVGLRRDLNARGDVPEYRKYLRSPLTRSGVRRL